MRKLMLLSVVPAVALLVAAPAALAQGFDQESKSGDVALESSLKDDAGRCAAVLQAVNTSNLQNAQGVSPGGGGDQYDDDDGEGGSIEVDGSTLTISPELERECKDTINRSTPKAKAGEVKGEAKAGKAEAKAGEAKAGGAEAKAGEKAEAKAGGAEAKAGKAEAKTEAKAEAKVEPAATPEVQAETPKTEAKSGGVQAKELPRTGGSGGASLLALGAGVLLVGGGLVVRRYLR